MSARSAASSDTPQSHSSLSSAASSQSTHSTLSAMAGGASGSSIHSLPSTPMSTGGGGGSTLGVLTPSGAAVSAGSDDGTILFVGDLSRGVVRRTAQQHKEGRGRKHGDQTNRERRARQRRHRKRRIPLTGESDCAASGSLILHVLTGSVVVFEIVPIW